MLKATSFNDAFDFLSSCDVAFASLVPVLGDNLEILQEALNLYAQDSTLWGCYEDGDCAALMALSLVRLGYNSLKPEFDVTRKFMTVPKDA